MLRISSSTELALLNAQHYHIKLMMESLSVQKYALNSVSITILHYRIYALIAAQIIQEFMQFINLKMVKLVFLHAVLDSIMFQLKEFKQI